MVSWLRSVLCALSDLQWGTTNYLCFNRARCTLFKIAKYRETFSRFRDSFYSYTYKVRKI